MNSSIIRAAKILLLAAAAFASLSLTGCASSSRRGLESIEKSSSGTWRLKVQATTGDAHASLLSWRYGKKMPAADESMFRLANQFGVITAWMENYLSTFGVAPKTLGVQEGDIVESESGFRTEGDPTFVRILKVVCKKGSLDYDACLADPRRGGSLGVVRADGTATAGDYILLPF
jgi:hypothetical protein